MPILPAPLTKSNSPASKKYPRLNRIAGIVLPESWRRGAGSNRRIKALQASALPLGYRA